jgi:prolyl-tRNA editing enzyme YbaK/EbsC (Cys-tRNA(Pro) deacylase)
MISIQTYSENLKKMNIEHKIVEHPELQTPKEVQDFLGLDLSDGLSTLLMKSDNEFIVVIKRCDNKIDSKKIKAVLRSTSLRMATPEEFFDITKLPLGTARAVNLSLRTILDKNIFEKEFLTGGSGSFTCSFLYKSQDLLKIPNSIVVDVTQ